MFGRNSSTSGDNISTNPQPIFKNHMRSGIAREFPAIWDFAQLCSFIRLEVMIKNMIFVLSTNYKSVRRGCFPRYIKKSIPINVLRHRTCITISVRPLKNIILNLIQKKNFGPFFKLFQSLSCFLFPTTTTPIPTSTTTSTKIRNVMKNNKSMMNFLVWFYAPWSIYLLFIVVLLQQSLS